jgi:flagellar motility protein MotE (MotC chaperone)
MTKKVKIKNEDNSINAAIIVILIFLLILILLVPVMLIRYNVAGIGEKAQVYLKNVPVISGIIPEDFNDPRFMTKGVLTKKYLDIKNEYEITTSTNEMLTSEIKKLNKIKSEYNAFNEEKAGLEEREQKLLEEKISFEELKNNFYEDIKNEKKTEFKEYFETIEQEKAEELYKEVVYDEYVDEKIKEYVILYEKMEPENAAEVFNNMGISNIALIKKILTNMKEGQAASIISEMDAELAARVMKNMSEDVFINE